MAFLLTDDLRSDALFLAGEPAGASISSWYTKCIDYLDYALKTIVAGGTLGTLVLEGEDWPWALSFPRGTLQLLPAFNPSRTVTVTMTKDSTTVAFDSMTSGLSLVGYYIIVGRHVTSEGAFYSRVAAHTASATTATLDDTFPYTSVASTDIKVVPIHYTLPSDFLRFASPLFPQDGEGTVQVTAAGSLEKEYPLIEISQGTPDLCAPVGLSSNLQQLRFSHFPEYKLQLEFEYIKQPATITEGATTPEIPPQHRRLLSIGAAYLIAQDKQSDRAGVLLDQFQAGYLAMAEEYKMQYTRGAEGTAGRIFPRGRTANRRILRDATGRIIPF